MDRARKSGFQKTKHQGNPKPPNFKIQPFANERGGDFSQNDNVDICMTKDLRVL